jgi:hypothetical protein
MQKIGVGLFNVACKSAKDGSAEYFQGLLFNMAVALCAVIKETFILGRLTPQNEEV